MGQSGRVSLDAGFEATETYYVAVDSPNADPNRIVRASLGGVTIPNYFTPHEDMPAAVVVSKDARKIDDSGLYFDVTVEYSQRIVDIDTLVLNPIARPPNVTWTQEIVQEFREHDIEGKSFKDVLGFDIDAMPIEDVRPILTVIQNEIGIGGGDFDVAKATLYTGSVNSDLFFGQRRQAKVRGITGRKVFGSAMQYWEVTYVIVFRRDGWRWPIKHKSFHKRSIFGDKVVRIMDDGDPDAEPPVPPQAIPEPQAINHEGVPLGPDDRDYWMTYDSDRNMNVPSWMPPSDGGDTRRLFGLRRHHELSFDGLGIRT